MSSHERTETHCVGEALGGNDAPAGLVTALNSLTLVLSIVITPEMTP